MSIALRRAQVVASATGIHPQRALPYPHLVSASLAWDPTIQGARPPQDPLPAASPQEAQSLARRLALAQETRTEPGGG
jgi:hypothetical protein